MQIVVAKPRGFCAGVEHAIRIVERALQAFGAPFSAPIVVRHEIVHNRRVVDMLRAVGAVFVEALAALPGGTGPGALTARADDDRGPPGNGGSEGRGHRW